MKSRVAGLLAAVLGCQLAAVSFAATASAAGGVGEPGLNNAITDVPGVEVGQVQSDTAPYLTGTSVVYFPQMSVAGVDQRGGAPATKETDLLSPLNSNPGVNAIQLGGSSMYGLSATNGIIRWLEDRGEGVPLGSAGVAPIVPAADIYDLARGGDPKARTSAEWGYVAAKATADGPVRQGGVGGGTGARSGGYRSGVGTASVNLGNGVYVGAMVVVNSAGSPVDQRDCSLLGVQYGIGDEFAGFQTPKASECHPPKAGGQSMNTTIAVVATNASLEKAAAERMAVNAHDGMARAIDPIHTLADGDTVFGVSTGHDQPLQINDPADGRQLNAIFNAGATTLSRAIAHALLSATSQGDRLSYCDTYPSACANMPQLQRWRTNGSAPDMTPAAFNQAAVALKQTPIPPPMRKQPAQGDTNQNGVAAPVAAPPSGGGGAGAGSPVAPALASGLTAAVLMSAAGVWALRRRPHRALTS